MPTYEYQCDHCGLRFDVRQSITDTALTECRECHGPVRRMIGGGAGFILKKMEERRVNHASDQCSFERTGTTCCGRDARCGAHAKGGTS